MEHLKERIKEAHQIIEKEEQAYQLHQETIAEVGHNAPHDTYHTVFYDKLNKLNQKNKNSSQEQEADTSLASGKDNEKEINNFAAKFNKQAQENKESNVVHSHQEGKEAIKQNEGASSKLDSPKNSASLNQNELKLAENISVQSEQETNESKQGNKKVIGKFTKAVVKGSSKGPHQLG